MFLFRKKLLNYELLRCNFVQAIYGILVFDNHGFNGVNIDYYVASFSVI